MASETERLDRAAMDLAAPAVRAVARQELERWAHTGNDFDVEEVMSLFAIAGSGASREDVLALERVVTSHQDIKARLGAVTALGTVGDDPDVDWFLARIAEDPAQSFLERYAGWFALRRRNREALVSEATRREILRLWRVSGVENLAAAFR